MRRLELRPGFVALSCLAFYLCPGHVFRAWTLLCLLHELGHMAAMAVCGVRVERIRLRARGAGIEAGPCAHRAEAVCALAGPAVNLLAFWALRRAMPGAALISFTLGVCNLLPVYPQDGGRALRAICSQILPPHTDDAVDRAVTGAVLAILGICALLAVRSFGLLPVWGYAVLLVHLAQERNLLLPSRGRFDIM